MQVCTFSKILSRANQYKIFLKSLRNAGKHVRYVPERVQSVHGMETSIIYLPQRNASPRINVARKLIISNIRRAHAPVQFTPMRGRSGKCKFHPCAMMALRARRLPFPVPRKCNLNYTGEYNNLCVIRFV